jgi:acyl-ACP thioesterase
MDTYTYTQTVIIPQLVSISQKVSAICVDIDTFNAIRNTIYGDFSYDNMDDDMVICNVPVKALHVHEKHLSFSLKETK